MLHRRVLLALTLVSVLLGCDLVAPEPDTTPDPPSVTVGGGEVDGVAWSVSAYRNAEQLCFRMPVHEEESCQSPIEEPRSPLGGGLVPGVSIPPSELPMVVHGLTRRDVALVRVESDAGSQEADVVALGRLGVPAGAYAVAFPPGTRITLFVALSADGRELERKPW